MAKAKSPMQLLEHGIIEGSWVDVRKAFKLMFGNEPPQKKGVLTETIDRERLLVLANEIITVLGGEVTEYDKLGPIPPSLAIQKKTVKKKARPTPPPPEDEELDDDEDEGPGLYDDPEVDEDDEPDDDEPVTVKRNGREIAGANRFAVQQAQEEESEDDGGSGNGNLRCQSTSFQKPKGKNLFIDDGTLHPELIKDTKKKSRAFKGKTHRAPPVFVLKKCICGKKERVAPETLMSGQRFKCNDCIRGG